MVGSPPYSKIKSRLYIDIALFYLQLVLKVPVTHCNTPSFMWSQSGHSGAQLTIMTLQGAPVIWSPFATFPGGSPEANITGKPTRKVTSCFSKSLLLFLSHTTFPPHASIQPVWTLVWLIRALPCPPPHPMVSLYSCMAPLCSLPGTPISFCLTSCTSWDYLFIIMGLWWHLGLPGIAVTKQCGQVFSCLMTMPVPIAIIIWGLSVFVLSRINSATFDSVISPAKQSYFIKIFGQVLQWCLAKLLKVCV